MNVNDDENAGDLEPEGNSRHRPRRILMLAEGAAAPVTAAFLASGSVPLAGIVAVTTSVVIAIALFRGH